MEIFGSNQKIMLWKITLWKIMLSEGLLYLTIQATQLACTDPHRAPGGCTQWFFGGGGAGYLTTFNYASGQHLANQKHIMCVR